MHKVVKQLRFKLLSLCQLGGALLHFSSSWLAEIQLNTYLPVFYWCMYECDFKQYLPGLLNHIELLCFSWWPVSALCMYQCCILSPLRWGGKVDLFYSKSVFRVEIFRYKGTLRHICCQISLESDDNLF